jgi:hypothetical protein
MATQTLLFIARIRVGSGVEWTGAELRSAYQRAKWEYPRGTHGA